MQKCKWLVLAMAVLLLAAGCADAKAKAIPNAEQMYGKMEELGLFPEMVRRGADLIYDFYGIDSEKCVQLLDYVTEDGLIADEVFFAETKDESYAKEVEQVLRDVLAHQAETYRDYMPEEYDKLKNGRIERSGTTVLMIVSDHGDELYKVYTDAVK